jgi:hypothetical protein
LVLKNHDKGDQEKFARDHSPPAIT